jgi:hypothetical protein
MQPAGIVSLRKLDEVDGEMFSGLEVTYRMDEQSMIDASPKMYDKLCTIAGCQLYSARGWKKAG